MFKFSFQLTLVQLLCTHLVPPPDVLDSLLGHHGQALPQAVERVDRRGVVVDAGLAGEAVPVLAQPVQIQVERNGRRLAGLKK